MTNLAVMPKQRRLKQCMSAAFSPLTPECSSWTQASLLSAQCSVLSAQCSSHRDFRFEINKARDGDTLTQSQHFPDFSPKEIIDLQIRN